MKYLRLSLIAAFLTLILTGSAVAGDIQCGFASTGNTTNELGAIDPVVEIASGLVQSVLALF